MSLAAATCGGSSSDGASAGSNSEERAKANQAAKAATSGGVDEDAAKEAISGSGDTEGEGETEEETEPAAELASIEDYEALWAEQRAAIVEDIKANGYGVDDAGMLTGPGGWTADLSGCPAEWSDTEGIVDGTITLGLSIAQSGTLAAYGNIATGMEAYFNYVNDNGGIGPDGLQVALSVKDDAYDAALTQEYVEEFLGSIKPFSVQTLGTPNTFSVRDRLNDACVPHPMALTGHPAWGDPQGYPWTTGLQLNYFTEGVLWAGWIEANMADQAPVKVAALVADNDFGLAYEAGFMSAAEGSDVIDPDVELVRHDAAAATLTNEITTLAAANPAVFIAMTAGAPCTIAFQEAARAGIVETAEAVWAPSVCATASFLGPAEDAADGWLALGGGWKDMADENFRTNDVYVKWAVETMDAAGADSTIGLVGTGFGEFGWPHIQALQIAAELDGGVTRTNYMIALRALDMTHPALLEGVAFSNNGAEDAYLVEGTQINKWNAATQSSEQIGDVIDLNGSSGTCSWTESGCA
ncbi:MAG: hypothetical protein R2710_08900 [Acidimicrobiales bacterium]